MIRQTISKFVWLLMNVICYGSIPLFKFIFGKAGKSYGLGPFTKLRLLLLFLRNSRMPGCESSFLEHVVLADSLLCVPAHLEGDVAEFGCYKGASTASLSLVCALVGRRLIVFDSFRGLPEPDEPVRHIVNGTVLTYRGGDFSASLEEVRHNVTKFGKVDVCEFVPGYFVDTLPTRNVQERFVMVFEDSDLPSSVRSVLKYAWPRLQQGCKFFTHEARDLEVVRIFFEEEWWQNEVGCAAPGLVGSGLGLPLGVSGSCLAYAMKVEPK